MQAIIDKRNRTIAKMKESFSKEKSKLIYYGDIETDLNMTTIDKLRVRLDEQTKLVASLK